MLLNGCATKQAGASKDRNVAAHNQTPEEVDFSQGITEIRIFEGNIIFIPVIYRTYNYYVIPEKS